MIWLMLAAALAGDSLPTDLSFTTSTIVPGRTMTMAVEGLNPNEPVYIVRSNRIRTAGTCLPQIDGDCIDLARPASLLVDATADAAGRAELSLVVPRGVPLGANVALQAVAVRGLNGSASVASPALIETVVDIACGDGVLDAGETCDDGNLVSGDGCDNTCYAESCPGATIPVDERRVEFQGLHSGFPVSSLVTDDGLLVGGTLTGTSAVVARLDADLEPMWSLELPGRNDTELHALTGTTGGFFAVGTDEPGGYYQTDARVVKLSDSGSLLWTRTYDNSHWWDEDVVGAFAKADGGLMFYGNMPFNTFYNNDNPAMTANVAPSGDVLWGQHWETQVSTDTRLVGGVELSTGDLLTVGYSGARGVLVRPAAAAANSAWTRRYHSTYSIDFTDVLQTPNGDLIVSGTHQTTSSSGSTNAFIARLDADGEPIWSTALLHQGGGDEGMHVTQIPATCELGASSGDACSTLGAQCAQPSELCQCIDGAWTCSAGQAEYLLGIESSTTTGTHPVLARFSADGALQQAVRWNGASFLDELAVTDVGGVVATSHTSNAMLFLRTDRDLTEVGTATTLTMSSYPLGFSDTAQSTAYREEEGMTHRVATTVPGAYTTLTSVLAQGNDICDIP